MNRVALQKVHVTLSPDELAAVDDFRFQSRITTRAEAIRELLRRGLRCPTPHTIAPLSPTD